MSKGLLFDVLSHKKVSRPGWVPFAGVHAGKLCGHSPEDMLKDPQKLIEALREVHKLYQPDGMPIAFDLQIEAEILGCELKYSPDGPPQVVSHPLQGDKRIPCDCLMPDEHSGRLPVVLEATRQMKEEVGEEVALYGLVCGPFTLASHLRGTEIFIDMYDDMDYVKKLVEYCQRFIETVSQLYIDAGADVVAVVDPLVSQISKDHFKEVLDKPYRDVFSFLREKDVYSSFFVCGDATRNIEAMCETAPDSISIDENIDMKPAKKITDSYNVALGGNIPLTTVMLHGSQQDNMKYAIDLIDELENSEQNLIISPGCDMPYDTPPENTIGIAQAVRDPMKTRESLKNYTAASESPMDVDLPDYNNLKKPLVEVFTLDSETCAACTYMMGAANKAKERFGDKIDIVEHKFTQKETIARCQKMGVTNLPAIYINGELKFSSIIPSLDELSGKIQQVL